MRTFKLISFFSLLFFSQLVFSGELKIGVVDVQAAIDASNHAKKITDQLEKEFGPSQTDLKALQKEIAGLQDRYNKDSAVMGETESRRLEQEISEKQSRLKFEAVELQRKVQARQQELSEPLMKIVQQTLDEFVKEGKYDLILHKQAALFSTDSIDLTQKLTEKLNQKQ